MMLREKSRGRDDGPGVKEKVVQFKMAGSRQKRSSHRGKQGLVASNRMDDMHLPHSHAKIDMATSLNMSSRLKHLLIALGATSVDELRKFVGDEVSDERLQELLDSMGVDQIFRSFQTEEVGKTLCI